MELGSAFAPIVLHNRGKNAHNAFMAYNERTTNRPSDRRDILQDASQYNRSAFEGRYGYGLEDQSAYEDLYPQRNVNQYSRYNAGAYSSRRNASAYGAQNDSGNDADLAGSSFEDESEYDDFFEEDESFRSYGRESVSRYAQARKRKKRKKTIVRMLIAIIALLLIGAGAAFAYVNNINGNLSKGIDKDLKDELVKTNMTKEPFYMLLLGTDASLERENDETYGESFRTDTILLARIDPIDKKVTLVSMPRDTMLEDEVDGDGNPQKLNAAYAVGGASEAVKEVSKISGVGISHFCLIDMDGLTSVVDALGGIEVDVPITIDDEDAGGHLDAGLQTLNGEQALILCRSRNAFEEYGAGDMYRAANQRMVLQAIASKVLSSDIGTIAKTVTALSEYISTDLSVNDVIGLAQAFQGIDTANSIYTGSLPTKSEYINEIWYEVIIEDAWKAMMKRVEDGLPPSEETESDDRTGIVFSNSGTSSKKGSSSELEGVSVAVRNGTDVDGAGSGAAGVLEGAGCTIADVKGADTVDYQQTLVIYADSSMQETAEKMAEMLGDGAQAMLNDGSYTMSGDYLVVVGADLASELATHADSYTGEVVSDDDSIAQVDATASGDGDAAYGDEAITGEAIGGDSVYYEGEEVYY